jgi:hypothetical protein
VSIRRRRLLLSGALAVLLAMSVLAIGHLWAPDPPRDPEALVLRVVFVKGMGSPVERPVPDIAVYGDGRMVTTLPDRRMVTDQRLTYPAYRRVYRDARRAAGRLGATRLLLA